MATLSVIVPITANATMKSTPIYNSGGRTNRMLITQTTGGGATKSPTTRPSLPTGKGLGSSGSVAQKINTILNQNNGNNSTALNRRTIN